MNAKNTLSNFMFLLLFALTISSCKKEKEISTNANAIPYYDEVPTIIVESYINRLFIDLIGREPLDEELQSFVVFLREDDLSFKRRDSLVSILQNNTTPREGDISYHHAYHHWFYNQMLVEVLDQFASNEEINEKIGLIQDAVFRDSLVGDTSNNSKNRIKLSKLQNVINSEENYRLHNIGFKEMLSYMVNNELYDEVNMNSFNFINATFFDLFYRYPTQSEFQNAFSIIENGQQAKLFGKMAKTKDDYVDLLVNSREFYNGVVMRTYLKLQVREPSSAETLDAMQTLFFDNDLKRIQRKIMVSDEYAQFKPRY